MAGAKPGKDRILTLDKIEPPVTINQRDHVTLRFTFSDGSRRKMRKDQYAALVSNTMTVLAKVGGMKADDNTMAFLMRMNGMQR